MPLSLRPFPRLWHPPAGPVLSALPVTRNGLRHVPPGQLVPTDRPAYGELRIRTNATGARSRGLCGLLPAAAFLDGRIRPHEQTLRARLEKQEGLVLDNEGGLGKPVLITVPTLAALWERVDATLAPSPHAVTFAGANNYYELLQLTDGSGSLSLAGLGPVCIADGHHRAETHARLAARGVSSCEQVPVCIIGADQLEIGVFARLIDRQFSDGELLTKLKTYFEVRTMDAPCAPAGVGEWLFVREGKSYHLRRRGEQTPFDGTWLNDVVLPEVFGITDVRSDGRITFEPVATQPGQPVDFPFPVGRNVLIGYPLPPATFFAEVAAGRLLPPKSTRFEPRVPSGLLVWRGA